MTSSLSGCDFAAGWLSGICSLVVGHPIDTIKVWKQTVEDKTTTKEIITNIYKTSGIKGYFRGMLFPLVSAGALNSLFFGIYGNSMRLVQKWRQVEPVVCVGDTLPYPYWQLDVFISGCVGGVAGCMLVCPVELVKIQMQTQTNSDSSLLHTGRIHRYSGPWECLVDQYRALGVRGLYRGLVPLLWRDVPSSGIFVLAYDRFCCMMGESRADKEHQPHLSTEIVGGAIAGTCARSPAVPFDVIKSRMQADSKTYPHYKGMFDCIVKSYKHDGLPVFFRGFWLITFKAVPVTSIIFVTYEYFVLSCNTLV